MNATRLLATLVISASSQVFATAPVPKNIGCPPDVPCTGQGNGGSGGSPGNTGAKPATPAAPLPQKATLKKAELNQAVFSAPGKITIAAMLTGDRPSSNNCQFIANVFQTTAGADSISMAVVSGVKLTGSLPGLVGPIPADLKPGKYRVDFFVDNEATSACKGNVSAPFEVQHQQMGPPPAKIVDIITEPGKKMGGTDRYRNDEVIKFKVVGNIENAGTDVTKHCGWTAQLEGKDGSVKVIGSNSQFGVWQNSLPLAGLGTDSYTLTVKTTAADDALAKQPCAGKVSKKIDIFATPGKINGVHLESEGFYIIPSHWAILTIVPKISGSQCTYKMTRKTNYVVGSGVESLHVHKTGDVDPDIGLEIDGTETTVEIFIEGTGFTGSCEGKAYKAITVYDEKGKKGLVH